MALYSLFGSANTNTTTGTSLEVDEDDITVAAGENRNSNGREMREICLKWVFPMSGDKGKILQSHYAVLALMLKAHPDLVVIDNKSREHVEKKTLKPTDRNRPFEFFSDKRNRSKRTLMCIHRLRTNKTLQELKESWGVMEALRKANAYIKIHAFGEKDREISHLGFIPGVSMVNIPREVVKDEITSMLKQEQEEIPPFEIIQVRVDMGKNSKAGERTRAYEIQCLQRDASRLAKLLQSGNFRERPVYVPYSVKRSNPTTFKGAIKKQIKTLTDQWVIKIQGFTNSMMASIREIVLATGAEAIIPTRNLEKGEWKVLVHRNAFPQILEQLQRDWRDIVDSISEVELVSSPFQEPKIATRTAAALDVGSEEGTVDTYGTILSSLYYGPQEEEDLNSEDSGTQGVQVGHTQTRPVSYAQVTRGTVSSESQVSGWTEQRHDDFEKLQAKHTFLEDKFNSVTAELDELKNLLKKLLAQQQTQAETEPPTKKQAMFNTPQRAERRKSPRKEGDMDMEQEPARNGSEAGQSQQQIE